MVAKKPRAPKPKACEIFTESLTPKERPHSWKNPKYRAEMCEEIQEYYKEGMADVQVCVKLDISRDTFYQWIKDRPEFSKAVEAGRILSEAWWISIAQGAVSGKHKSDSKIWAMNMKNRFKWRDNPNDPQSDREKVIDEIARKAALYKEREQQY